MTDRKDPDERLTDQQLDALLRKVDVPADLMDSLRAIPQTHAGADSNGDPNEDAKTNSVSVTVPKTETAHSLWRGSLLMALAATLLAVGAFFAWPFVAGQNTNGPEVVENVENDGPVPKSTDPQPAPAAGTNPDRSEILVAAETANEAIEAALHEVEMQQLRNRLAEIKQSTPSSGTMDPHEYNSLITAIADQTILELGGSEEAVRDDMAQVIKLYPNTTGAAIAQEFINSHTN